MNAYYVDRIPQKNGAYEVHNGDCAHLPAVNVRTYLGEFAGCQEAVSLAQMLYSEATGCYRCSTACCAHGGDGSEDLFLRHKEQD